MHLRPRRPGLRRDDDDRLHARVVSGYRRERVVGLGQRLDRVPRGVELLGRHEQANRHVAVLVRDARRPPPRAWPRSPPARGAPGAPPPRRRCLRPSTWTSSVMSRTLHPARRRRRAAPLGRARADRARGAGRRSRSKSRGTTVAGKILRRLVRDLRPGVAGGEVREREQADARLAGDAAPRPRRSSDPSRAPASRSSARNVASWTSTSAPRAASTTDARRRGVAGEHDRAPPPRRPERPPPGGRRDRRRG